MANILANVSSFEADILSVVGLVLKGTGAAHNCPIWSGHLYERSTWLMSSFEYATTGTDSLNSTNDFIFLCFYTNTFIKEPLYNQKLNTRLNLCFQMWEIGFINKEI